MEPNLELPGNYAEAMDFIQAHCRVESWERIITESSPYRNITVSMMGDTGEIQINKQVTSRSR